MDSQLKKGVLDVCVLAVLKRGESYGYRIIQDISPYIEISESTLYPVLKRLENNEYVKARREEFNGRLRRYYNITTLGVRRINEFLDDIEEIDKAYKFILREGHKS